LLNRKGESRVDIKQKIKLSNNSFILQKGNSLETSSIVNTKDDGSLVRILFNGELDIMTTEEKWPFSHIYQLNNDYEIVLKLNTLTVQGKSNFTYTFDSNISNVNYFNINDNSYFTASSAEKNKIFILDSNGAMLENSPLYGTTEATISTLESENIHLIFGSEDGTIYNYLIKK